MQTNETNKQDNTRKFHQDFLWGLKNLKMAYDALMEIAALRYIITVCEKRVRDLNEDAIALAKDDLRGQDRADGLFMHKGDMFKLSEVIELVL